ncbi:MAG: fibronectin type III domain-containing protein [Micrococcales bacterium]
MFAGLLKKLRAALLLSIAFVTILGVLPAQAAAPVVRNSYILTVSQGSNAFVKDLISRLGETPHDELTEVLDGFVLSLTDSEVLTLQADSHVLRVEQDQPMSLMDSQNPTPSWGLDRIDQTNTTYDNTYNYPATAGAGVNIYIVDTGIMATNPDFAGRTEPGFDVFGQNLQSADCNGHGTHVAGTAAGTTYGVAKKATIVPVRVLGCNGSGTWGGFIAGLDWIVKNRPAGVPAVMSASLGGTKLQSVNDAVQALYAAGVTPVIAAGNSSLDACGYSPASAPDAITVGATDSTDNLAWFSNWGDCVDVFAPGVNIVSDNYLDPTTPRTLNGTSMATPHVSGLAALYLSGHPTDTPAQVTAAIKAGAQSGVVTNAKTASNLLINTGFVKAALPPVGTPTAVTVSGVTTTGAQVSWVAPVGTQAAQTYNVDYKTVAATSWATVTTDLTTIALTGLAANTAYSVRVSSVNGTTVSAPSAETMFTTKGLAPAAPANIRTTAVFGNQATLTWDAPNGNGSVITSYSVYIVTGNAKTLIGSTSATTYVVPNLTPSTAYAIAIEAKNANGVSPLSAPFVFTTTAATPLAVSRITFSNITATTATASWTAVPPLANGTPITYNVATYVYSSLGWLIRPVYTTTATTLNLSGLTRYASQGLIITAYSGLVAGPASSMWSFNTLQTVPGAITSFTSTRIAGTNTTTLAWLPPADNGGAVITGYLLEKFDGVNWVSVGNLAATVQSYVVTLPARGTFDNYRISALNALGAGAVKTLSVALANTAPAAPTGVTATLSADQRTVTLTWVAPTDDGGTPITCYRILAGATATSFTTVVSTVSATTLSTTIAVPLRGAPTYFVVVALNAVGVGAASSVVSVTRPLGVPVITSAPTATWNTDGTLHLAWSVPADNGGAAITGYKIQRLEAGAWVNKATSNTNALNVPREAPGTVWQYRVIATNSVGDSLPGPASVNIQVPFAKASAPQNFTAIDNGSFVTASFTAPADLGGGTVGYYAVLVSKDGGATWINIGTTPGLTVNVYRPTKGQTWQYRVVAVTQPGPGDVSTTISIAAAMTVPGSTSSSVTFAADGSINLVWYASLDNGGSPIVGYKVEKSFDATTWSTVTTTPGNQLALNLPRENPGVRVYFRVSAINAIGIGATYASSIMVPYLKATAPQNVVITDNGSAVVATWAAPANLGGSPSVSYQIQVSRDGGATFVSYTSTSALSIAVPRPAKGTAQLYRMIAWTAYGYSDASPATNIAAALTVPSVPGYPSLVMNADKSMTAKWVAATDNGGTAATGFRIQTSTDGTNWSTSPDVLASTLTVTLPETNPGVRTYFRVAQVNATGVSAYTGYVSVLNPIVIAAAPSNLNVVVTGQTATVTWTASSSFGGATGVNYLVTASIDGTNFVAKGGTSGTAFSFAGLAKGSNVWVRVVAQNQAGLSVPVTSAAVPVANTVASAITSVAVTRASTSFLSFNFAAPTDLGGYTGYNYLIQQWATNRWVTIANGTGAANNTVLVGVPTSAATINYRVIATNPSGDTAPYILLAIK